MRKAANEAIKMDTGIKESEICIEIALTFSRVCMMPTLSSQKSWREAKIQDLKKTRNRKASDQMNWVLLIKFRIEIRSNWLDEMIFNSST